MRYGQSGVEHKSGQTHERKSKHFGGKPFLRNLGKPLANNNFDETTDKSAELSSVDKVYDLVQKVFKSGNI